MIIGIAINISVVIVRAKNKSSKTIDFSSLVNAGIITPDEAREKLNFPTLGLDTTSEIRIPQNITGSATSPELGGRPSSDDTEDMPITEPTNE